MHEKIELHPGRSCVQGPCNEHAGGMLASVIDELTEEEIRVLHDAIHARLGSERHPEWDACKK